MRVLQIIVIGVLVSCSAVFAQEAPPPAKVVTTAIGQRDVAENRSFLGLLYYDRMSHVSSEVAGLVASVAVREGNRVKSGAPLVRLDTEILAKEIALKRTRVEQADLHIGNAEKNYLRLKRLHSQEGVSEKEYEDALYTFQNAEKEKQAATEELGKLLIRQRKSTIKAPFDGIILDKQVDAGDWVQQGKELVAIGSIQDLFVRVPVAETVLQFVTIGEEVPVKIHAFDKEVSGIIEDVDPTADAQTKNVFLKVRIPPMDRVAENMSATVFVPTSAKRQLAIIPRDALIKFQGKDFVYTVKEGKAAILPVHIVTYLGTTVGADNPYFAPGMPVVIEGNERLQPDQPVTVAGDN